MKRYFIVTILLGIFLFSLNSCEKEESNWNRPTDISPYVPSDIIGLSGGFGCDGTYVDISYTISFWNRLDFWQLKVNSIEYYIDDELIESQEEEPYSIIYHGKNLSEGKHKFTIRANFTDLCSNKKFSVDKIKEFDIIAPNVQVDQSKVNLYTTYSMTTSSNSIWFNLQEVILSSELKNANWNITSVTYYLDEEKIGESSTEPFSFTYSAELSLGKHYIKLTANIHNSTTNQNETVERIIEAEIK